MYIAEGPAVEGISFVSPGALAPPSPLPPRLAVCNAPSRLVLCDSEGPHRAGGKRAALAMAMVRVPALLGPMVVGIVSKPGGEVLASGPRESVEEEGATLAPPVFSGTTTKIL